MDSSLLKSLLEILEVQKLRSYPTSTENETAKILPNFYWKGNCV